MKIDLKPLSQNQSWRGRRFKTKKYEDFEEQLYYLLENGYEIPEGDLKVWYVFGQSSKNCDWDNPIKQFQDVLSKKYKFNDNRIFRGLVDKIIVPKGEEFCAFQIKSVTDNFEAL